MTTILNFQFGLKTKQKKLIKNRAISMISKVKLGIGMFSIKEIKGNKRSENHILGDTIIGIRNAKKANNLTQNSVSFLRF